MNLHVRVNYTQIIYCKVNRTAEIGNYLLFAFI